MTSAINLFASFLMICSILVLVSFSAAIVLEITECLFNDILAFTGLQHAMD